MANKKEEPSPVQQGEAAAPPPPQSGSQPAPPEQQHRSHGGNPVFKCGPLFISSKGIGWTTWKKRWFILTRTSLVFFRSDPSAAPQKGGEVNLTLGGIDLNNSGSVAVKADKKLLTVLFPDGRDGRTFTLKAETSEDLIEWKTALENALAQAPNPAHVMGQNGILRKDQVDAVDGSKEQPKEKTPTKSSVTGTPILHALEDADGAPTFLEKALRFVEQYGVKVEGILRQAADVEDVERRIREYEQGKTEFTAEEDAHIIADCVKYILRELPSSPVPASCCKALLEACRTESGNRVNAMRGAISETFPEPNRRLLQRILMMMQAVASNKAENRMSSSAVAACMAPLILRPLLHGEYEIENDFDLGGDSSLQLMQAAAAANHAQAIVITLLEEYKKIFAEGSVTPYLSDSEESGSEGEEGDDDYDDDDESYIDDEEYESDDLSQGSEEYSEDDLDHASNSMGSENDESGNDDLDDGKVAGDSKTPAGKEPRASQKLQSSSVQTSLPEGDHNQRSKSIADQSNSFPAKQTNDSSVGQVKKTNKSVGQSKDASAEEDSEGEPTSQAPMSDTQKSSTTANGPGRQSTNQTVWRRAQAKKNLSMESIDLSLDEEEEEIERLEASKADLEHRIGEEVKGNAILQASLGKRRKTLNESRLALEKDVARLQEQMRKEGPLTIPPTNEKTKTKLEEITQTEVDTSNSNQVIGDPSTRPNQREQNSISTHDSGNHHHKNSNHQPKQKFKSKEGEGTGLSFFGRSRSKEKREKERMEKEKLDNSIGGAEHQNENKQQEPSPNQQSDSVSARSSNSKSDHADNVSSTETTPSKPSKKSGLKGEGGSGISALSKLSHHLNNLKERRSQIASDLLNMEKGRGFGRKGSEPNQSSSQNPEKSSSSKGSDTNPPSHDQGAGGARGQTRKEENHEVNEDRRVEDQPENSAVLDRGRSEGHVTYNKDEPPEAGDDPPVPHLRTNSR